MWRFYIPGFFGLLAFDTLAQVSFKLAATHAAPFAVSGAWLLRVFDAPWIYGAMLGYLGAFGIWMSLLKRAPIGPAFAASHLEVLSVLAVSAMAFGEVIGWQQLLGCGAIVAGIVCLAISERNEAH